MRTPAALAQVAITFALALMMGATQAAPSTKFEPALQVQGVPLQLNGAGTRFKAIFKVYDMGLYTTKKVSTAEELLALPGPKRLQFVALRELPSTDLGRLFIKGMSENSPREMVQKHTVSSSRLIEVFSGRSKLMPGDSFAMEFVPNKGTQFYIVGQPQGGPVGDAEFFAMVLKIWFGASPADNLLKDALLGAER
ncbi:MAG: chalcone isomerase family protein [Cytophagales bacterium]|nr:chalcone isomerase family protein [Rhizobacter sp.]